MTKQKASIEADGFDFDVEFDVTENETHRGTARVTDHPVEEGADITDHIVDESDTLDLTARVTNTPIVSEAEAASLTGPRAEEAYERLRLIKSRKLTVNAITTLRTYENMAILELGVSRNATTGNVLAVSLKLRQIRTVTSQVIDVPTPVVQRGKALQDTGKKTPVTAPAPVAEKSETLLLRFGRAISTNVDKLAQ